MKVAGQATLHAPIERVWDALNDPAVLVRTIPGCQQLAATGPDAYAMTVIAGVASIKGSYAGTVQLAELRQPNSFLMRASGAGAPGTVSAEVSVRLTEQAGATVLDYDADAVVGGMIGGVGQRMLSSVSKRMAGEFFGNVERALTRGPAGPEQPGGQPVEGATAGPVTAGARTGGAVYSPPSSTRSTAGGLDQRSFLSGVGVGAGLLLVGVLVGSRLRR
jgi:carbon monoxide dehydrogenase subunit G